MMSAFYFKPMPHNLSDEQHAEWVRRQRTAESTLAIQDLSGTKPNGETIAQFQRYISGEIALAQAIAQVREQIAQEHSAFRQYLERRNVS